MAAASGAVEPKPERLFIGETTIDPESDETTTIHGEESLLREAIASYETCSSEKSSRCVKGNFGSVYNINVRGVNYYMKKIEVPNNRRLTIIREIYAAIQLTEKIPDHVSKLIGSYLHKGGDTSTGYLLFEALPGMTLLQLILGKNRAHYKEIACSLKEAVRALYRAGFVHRDIKPENVFVVIPPEGSGLEYKCVLIDFGFTVPIRAKVGAAGTLKYMPPALRTMMNRTAAKPSHNIYSIEQILKEDLKVDDVDCLSRGENKAAGGIGGKRKTRRARTAKRRRTRSTLT